MAFKLPDLPYAANSLEPHIDERTMNIHHGKHHAGYTNKLNSAIEGTEMDGKTIEEILATIDDNASSGVRNNGGGYYNHSLFWKILSKDGGGKPTGALADAINEAFGSFDKFKEEFSNAAATQFGSGWAWLCVHKGGKVSVCSTPNQDNPLMPVTECDGTPILGIDVWEHAYYLNYQNRRPDYISAFFEVINWDQVAKNYEAGK